MNFHPKVFSRLALAVALATSVASSAAFAQAGGADVPDNAKAAGTMENGSSSTGMSKGEASHKMTKKHHMKKSMHHSM